MKKGAVEQEQRNKEKHYLCELCGKEIYGEPVWIRTKRGQDLYLHLECFRNGEKEKEG